MGKKEPWEWLIGHGHVWRYSEKGDARQCRLCFIWQSLKKNVAPNLPNKEKE